MAKAKAKSKTRDFIEGIIAAVLIALLITTFVIKMYKIPSRSMVPTLLVGDQLVVNKFIYGIKIPFFRKTIIPLTDPQRGDVIVFIYPQDRSLDFIKRVIGIGGDTIEIKDKKIFINDKLFEDKNGIYTDKVEQRNHFGPITVPVGSLFVMGDNRDESMDSRYWGYVDLKDVEGKAFIIYWSRNHEAKNYREWIRWERLGTLLH